MTDANAVLAAILIRHIDAIAPITPVCYRCHGDDGDGCVAVDVRMVGDREIGHVAFTFLCKSCAIVACAEEGLTYHSVDDDSLRDAFDHLDGS